MEGIAAINMIMGICPLYLNKRFPFFSKECIKAM
jgi:hypothetical protein